VEEDGDHPPIPDTQTEGEVAKSELEVKSEPYVSRDWGHWQECVEHVAHSDSVNQADVLAPDDPPRAASRVTWASLLGDDRVRRPAATSKITIPTVAVEEDGDHPPIPDTQTEGEVAKSELEVKSEPYVSRDWGHWQECVEHVAHSDSVNQADVLAPDDPPRAASRATWASLLVDDRVRRPVSNLSASVPNEGSSDTLPETSESRSPAQHDACNQETPKERTWGRAADGAPLTSQDRTPGDRISRGTLPARITRSEGGCTSAEAQWETVMVEAAAPTADPSAPAAGRQRRGTVKTFNPIKGYGFIQVHGEASDIFLPAHSIIGPQPGAITYAGGAPTGPEMEFDIEVRSGRQRAVNSRIVSDCAYDRRASMASTPSVASCPSAGESPKADVANSRDLAELLKMLPSDAPPEVFDYLSNLVGGTTTSWI